MLTLIDSKCYGFGLLMTFVLGLFLVSCKPGNDIDEILNSYNLTEFESRDEAIVELQEVAATDPESVREFLQTNKQQDLSKTFVCLKALTLEDPSGSVEIIKDFYDDSDPRLRDTVIGAIGKSNDPEIHAIVLEATGDQDEAVRATAFFFLNP